jgi:aminopeptidase N
MKFFFGLTIICVSFQCFALDKTNPAIDILHYQFDLFLYDSTDAISAIATIDLKIRQNLEAIILDLKSKGANGKGMTVKEVTQEGKSLKFSQTGELLTINLTSAISPETTLTIKILYGGIPEDGLIIGKNKYGDRTFFGDNWPDRAHHWLPVVDHPSDKASVDFIVTAPSHYEVIGNGIKLEESYISRNQKLTHWHEAVPLATKVMVIGAARFAIQYETVVSDIPVEHWVYPQNRLEGFHDYAVADKMLDFFIKKVGSYSYGKLANVQSSTRYGGMENASNIFYPESSVNGKAEYDNTIAHEIAHQWFGNSASETDWHHVWLSEGFATYFTHVYNEFAYGETRRREEMIETRNQIIENVAGKKLSVVFTSLPDDLTQILNSNSYQKGGWILHMLRKQIGEEAFWKGIRSYYLKYQNSNASTADFQSEMEKASGQQLDIFFNQWLYRAGHPEIEVKWTYHERDKKLEITLKQTENGDPFIFPLEISLLGDGKHSTSKKLEITQKTQIFSFTVDFKPSRIVLDPQVNLLFESKFKN